jgi:hypothetical protein
LQTSEAISQRATFIRFTVNGRQMEETHRYRLDGKVLATVRAVVSGTSNNRVIDDPATHAAV